MQIALIQTENTTPHTADQYILPTIPCFARLAENPHPISRIPLYLSMAKPRSKYYWYCQLAGWGTFLLADAILISLLHVPGFFIYLLLTTIIGFLITHLFRTVIRKYQWLNLPVRQSLLRVLFGFVAALTLASLIRTLIFAHTRLLPGLIEFSLLFTPWLLIYALYHVISASRVKTLEKQRLELLLKARQEHAAQSSVDINSLTQTLDRLRILIDQDPDQARAGITAFSQLLRTSYLKTE
jgi:two-component system LytT family sensor kinase